MNGDDEWAGIRNPAQGRAPPPPRPRTQLPDDEFAGIRTKPPPYPVYHSNILPFTQYSDQSVRFEPFESGLLSAPIQSAKAGGRLFGQAWEKGGAPLMEDVLSAAPLGVGLNPFVRSGDRAITGVVGRVADPRLAPERGSLPWTTGGVPSSEQLLERGGQQLNDVRALPARYNPPSLGLHVADLAEQDLINMGVFPGDSPQLYAALGRMRSVPAGAILEPGNLMSVRRNLANLFTNPNEHRAGVGTVLDRLNGYIQNPPAGAVLSGPAGEVGNLYGFGNANYAAGMRGRDLADIAYNARLKAASANSGQNADNSLRQAVRRTVVDDQAMRGYTPAEQQALEQIVTGAEGANFRRNAGNLLGGGGGLGAAVTGGLAAAGTGFLGGGPAAAGLAASSVPLLGGYLKRQAAARTARALEDVGTATRRRSQLFLDDPGPDVAPNISAGREILTRAIMQQQAQQFMQQQAQQAAPTEPPPESPPPEPPPEQSRLRINVRPLFDRYDPENVL